MLESTQKKIYRIYKIGDEVWHASRTNKEMKATCPDCFGNKYLLVILGDGSKVSIDCATCTSGYGGPRGYVTYYKQSEDVKQVTIDRVEINPTYVEYKSGCFLFEDTDVFPTKKEAEVRAKELLEIYNQQQLKRINQKEEKDRNHTWAWNVSYYRKLLRRAKADLKCATEKLEVAKQHVKEGKK